MMRTTPASALAPNSVPCGPRSTSTRSMSTRRRFGLPPWLVSTLVTVSPKYVAVVEGTPPSDALMPRMRIVPWPAPRSWKYTPGTEFR